MRSRNIKPQFWKNEELANCSFEARLLFIGLWGIADWKGRLECRPKRIKAEVFPYDNVDVDSCLEELQGQGLINVYNSSKHIHIPSFERHQHCHKNEKSVPSTFPEPSSNGITTELTPSENDTTPASYCLPLTESFLPLTDTPSTDGASKEKPEKKKINYQPILQAWEEHCVPLGLPKPIKIASKRKERLKACASDPDWMGILDEAITALVENPFNLGDNDRNWQADIDYLIRPGKAFELVEKHRAKNGTRPSSGKAKSPDHETWQEREWRLMQEQIMKDANLG